MTPKEKKLKLATITSLILVSGFKQDSYGNYKNQLGDTSYRIKLKSINIRIERKQPGSASWYKVISEPIVTIEMGKLISIMKRFMQQDA